MDRGAVNRLRNFGKSVPLRWTPDQRADRDASAALATLDDHRIVFVFARPSGTGCSLFCLSPTTG